MDQPDSGSAAAGRRFLLDAPPAGGRVELASGEAEHARRVMRLAAGDRIVGLDGRGGRWPLSVRRAERGAFEVGLEGEPEREPPPGAPGASLPWIEIAVAWPRGARAEAMVERLVQLGVAAIRPLAAERATPAARGAGTKLARVERIAREACKQCGRAWFARFEPEAGVAELAALPSGLSIELDPAAGPTLPEVLAATRAAAGSAGWDAGWDESAPLRVFAGPEGGFTPGERAALAAAGAVRARLAPHVLRIETAAEAAAAVIAAHALARPGARGAGRAESGRGA